MSIYLEEKPKVGQQLILDDGYCERFVTVAKVTPTGLIKLEEFPSLSFSKEGRQRGYQGFRYAPRLKVITEESKKRVQKAVAVRELDQYKWQDEELETLNKVLEVLGII